MLTLEELRAFNRDGYVIRRGLYTAEEAAALHEVVFMDKEVQQQAHAVLDASGRKSKLSVWNLPGRNIYGAMARCARMVDNIERILGDECYHYHSKVMMKEPKVGGAWEWHQDYGYWYGNGNPSPNMCSAMVAVNPNTLENGCLQVLKGSHHMGRVDHGTVGGQAGADPERIKWALENFEVVPAVLDPGDTLFFHCNTFHASGANTSDKPRWSLIMCFNAKSNSSPRKHHHPQYSHLERWADDDVLGHKGVGYSPDDGTVFMNPEEDNSAGVAKKKGA